MLYLPMHITYFVRFDYESLKWNGFDEPCGDDREFLTLSPVTKEATEAGERRLYKTKQEAHFLKKIAEKNDMR